jgi:hypothetical protein
MADLRFQFDAIGGIWSQLSKKVYAQPRPLRRTKHLVADQVFSLATLSRNTRSSSLEKSTAIFSW